MWWDSSFIFHDRANETRLAIKQLDNIKSRGLTYKYEKWIIRQNLKFYVNWFCHYLDLKGFKTWINNKTKKGNYWAASFLLWRSKARSN